MEKREIRRPDELRNGQFLLVDRFSHSKAVVDEALRGIPPTIGVQNHEEQIAAVLRDFRNQASACFGGESGLHPYHTGNAAE